MADVAYTQVFIEEGDAMYPPYNPGSYVLFANQDGQRVGMVAVDGVRVTGIEVAETHRRQGIARGLLAEAQCCGAITELRPPVSEAGRKFFERVAPELLPDG